MDRLSRLTAAEGYAYGVATTLTVLGLAENPTVFVLACMLLFMPALILYWGMNS
jgi:hypothetical protein